MQEDSPLPKRARITTHEEDAILLGEGTPPLTIDGDDVPSTPGLVHGGGVSVHDAIEWTRPMMPPQRTHAVLVRTVAHAVQRTTYMSTHDVCAYVHAQYIIVSVYTVRPNMSARKGLGARRDEQRQREVLPFSAHIYANSKQ